MTTNHESGADDITATPEFRAWFGDSKVVDGDGRPLVVYHGGAGGIRVFEPDRAGSVKTADWGNGVYFTPARWQAQSYMEDANKSADATSNALWEKMEETAARYGTGVMYASMDLDSKRITQKQYDEIKAIESEWRKARDAAEKNGSGEVYAAYLRIENPLIQRYDGITDPYLRERAEAKGHDGIIIVHDDGSFDEIVAFRPEQIKSAIGNRGTFDPANPNILFSQPAASIPQSCDSVRSFDPAQIARHQVPMFKSREKLVALPIADFLALVPEFAPDAGKLASVRALLQDDGAFSELPMLKLDADHRVYGHEGRHRALALMELGYDTMPIVLKSDVIRWSEQTNAAAFDYMTDWPVALRADTRAADPDFRIPFPVSREESSQAFAFDDYDDAPAPRRSRGMGW